ncbi:MAG TPA: PAS domain-containing protein [Tepidisphaeraceae bacterium]|nr:PAS domain-containing protein [Tepidisphaeraceae bacterium]
MSMRDLYRNWLSPQRWMARIGLRAPMQIVIGLVMLTACVLLFAEDFGLLPNQEEWALRQRIGLAEITGRSVAKAVSRYDFPSIQDQLAAIVGSNGVLSAALRRADGVLVYATPHHAENWKSALANPSDLNHIQMSFSEGAKIWGSLEIAFSPPPQERHLLVTFVISAEFLIFWLYLSRMLRMLDPSAAIPNRMQLLMDTLVEGMVVLDGHGQIVMANQALAQMAFCSTEQLIGRKLSSLAWKAEEGDGKSADFPWESQSHEDLQLRCVPMKLAIGTRHVRDLNVNVSPILGPDGKRRGVLVTFDDQTVVEKDYAQLVQFLAKFTDAGENIRSLRGQLPVQANPWLDQLETLAQTARELAQFSANAAEVPITTDAKSPNGGVGYSV